jgi:hypothetical protein
MNPTKLTFRAATLAVVFGYLAAAARAQAPSDRLPAGTERFNLAGPRFGVTFLTSQMRDSLRSHDINVGPVISQFGWQFERQFLGAEKGIVAVSEWVLLVGGLDQGVFLPSVSWLVGLRTPKGTELGVGPNVSAAGFSLVVAGGVTYRSGTINLPVNLAIVPSREGMRVGVITGFTMR